MTPTEQDPRVTKRRVTMTTVAARLGEDGEIITETHQATDYVRPDFLDAYVTDAKARWQSVVVSDEPDAGPGGYDGQTHIPESLDHPLAGSTDVATGV